MTPMSQPSNAPVWEEHVPTIYDVAKAANVSPKTVSRVLNGDAPVGKETRRLVVEAMDQLGYVPSNAARMMRSNRSGLIGLITGALSQKLDPMDPTGLPDLYIVHGIQQVLGDSGKTLMISDTGGLSERVPGLVRTFQQHRAEALIYVADYHKPVAFDFGAFNSPVVLVNCFDDAGTAAVLPDDEACQFALVQDLISAGHTRIAYLTLPFEMTATQLRLKGYRRALAAAGLGVDDNLIVEARNKVHGTADDGTLSRALNEILALRDPPTVICCGNDEMALSTYGVLRSNGVRVPDDMSVAGFDNYRAIAETLYPPLTTVDLPYREMGQRAANRVLEMIGGAPSAAPVTDRVGGIVRWRSSVTAHTNIETLRQNQGRNLS
jgi:LacI family transcriptional regulator